MYNFGVRWVLLGSLESPGLVHIDPDAVIGQRFIEVVQALEPHIFALRVEPVNKDGDFRPYLIDKIVIISLILINCRLYKYVILVTHRIILARQVFGRNGSIYDWDYLLLILVKLTSESSQVGECCEVHSEVFEVVHIRNV